MVGVALFTPMLCVVHTGHMTSIVCVTLQLAIIQLEGGNALVQKVSPAVYNIDIILC